MTRDLRISVVALAAFTLLLGVAYPWLVTAVCRVALPERSAGSLVVVDGRVRGSELVGQHWTGARWFHGRPSSTAPGPYEARASSGSNLGPSSPALAAAFAERASALRAQGIDGPLPVDLLTSSASGLDPHVTPSAARAQVERVARARGIERGIVARLVEQHVEGRALGFLGEPRVNVLRLNLALERLR